ncbi:MAG: response regulator [Cyanobacteria bacterium CRU_2_1]|nr:response regulator [Cyanobacteria bacterium RU_5_0]NJR58911.1 response regulator [Cyanobacteria bacterium CRU_2_1]
MLWRKLKVQIPSLNSIPVLNEDTAMRSNLSIEQKQRLEKLASGDRTLNDIASALAQDPLEIAKGFAQLINNGLVTLKSPMKPSMAQIVIVDDSPLILKQFRSLVTSWGYQVKLSQDPVTALQTILQSNPVIIFLDINMPEITGFELVKQIRRQPELASIPLVMLTAEKTLSNNWRAQWSGCRFLTKPLTPKEVPDFQMELRLLLEELAPLHTQKSVETILI